MKLLLFGILLISVSPNTLSAEIPESRWERFEVEGRPGFVIRPDRRAPGGLPWVFYAPTFDKRLPNTRDEGWMMTRFLNAGIAIAGIDVGESYGSPNGTAIYDAFHKHVVAKFNFAPKACLLARSRGGLMLYNWAATHPEKVRCIAGIYPVCNLASYPGLAKACGAYEMTEKELAEKLTTHNPIDRLAPLTKAGVPILHIHGDKDKVVPLDANSGTVAKRYQKLGGSMELIIAKGQWHNMWRGFFECQELVDFVIANAKDGKPKAPKVELLWAKGQFTEGPAPAPDGSILFSDVGASRIYKFDPKTGAVSVFRENSGRANGLMFDAEGRLIACEGANTGGGRRISITDAEGKVRTLAERWNGKRFNSPNDLAIDKQGNIYFTDPRYVGDEPREIDFEGIFLVRPDGSVKLATKEVTKPNGILVSLGGKSVYVADHDSDPSGPRQLLAFSVGEGGTLSDKKVLHDFGKSRGIDGMTLDADGNLYATAGSGEESGIYVFDPAGRLLRVIKLPGAPTNCVFGSGKDATVLYVTAQAPEGSNGKRPYALYRISSP